MSSPHRISSIVSQVSGPVEGVEGTGADVMGAILGAKLMGAVVTGAALTGEAVTGADVTGADVTGADVTGAVETGEALSGVLPLVGAAEGTSPGGNVASGGGSPSCSVVLCSITLSTK